MRIVRLDDDVVGERLGFALQDDGGRVLLAQGVVLTPRYVRLLERRGYRSVAIDDPLAPDAVPQDVVREEVRRTAVLAMRRTLAEAGRGRSIVVSLVSEVVDSILADMQDNAGLACSVSALRSLDEGVFFHSVNVCIYAAEAVRRPGA